MLKKSFMIPKTFKAQPHLYFIFSLIIKKVKMMSFIHTWCAWYFQDCSFSIECVIFILRQFYGILITTFDYLK
jgi:hypothetical protein